MFFLLMMFNFSFCSTSMPVENDHVENDQNRITIELTPRKVAELTLSQSLKAQSIELRTQKVFYALDQAKGVFDTELKFKWGYNYDKAETLSGNNNLLDETASLTFGLSKKTSFGTTLSLDYTENSIDSTLNPFSTTSSSRPSSQSLKASSLGLRQNLWQNYFGFADQKNIESVHSLVQQAQLDRVENLESLLLEHLTLFWNTFTAKEQLRLHSLAQEKYEYLVRTVKRKETLGIVTPGELSRLKAEQEATQQRILQASQSYLQNLNNLIIALKIQSFQHEVTFRVSEDLPSPPSFPPENWKADNYLNLRPNQSARHKLESLQLKKESTLNQIQPALDLVLKATATGVDKMKDEAIAEMVSASHPTYFLGLEFTMKLDSYFQKFQKSDILNDIAIAEKELQLSQDNSKNLLNESYRQVKANYLLAKSSNEIVELRNKVVRQVEEAYKQGRQPLVEVIRAYNDLFSSEIELAKSIGNYHVSLNRFDHFRSELITLIDPQSKVKTQEVSQ